MARRPAGRVQVTFRIPAQWLPEADALASTMSTHGVPASRTDAFREAMALGFRKLEEDAKKKSRYRVSAYDGRSSTCLFWFGSEKADAIAAAKRFAQENVGGRWTVFRVFEGDNPKPVEVVSVPEAKARRASR
jgi:hypothetical protein